MYVSCSAEINKRQNNGCIIHMSVVHYIWVKYDFKHVKQTDHIKFDPTEARTYDLQIMGSTFDAPETFIAVIVTTDAPICKDLETHSPGNKISPAIPLNFMSWLAILLRVLVVVVTTGILYVFPSVFCLFLTTRILLVFKHFHLWIDFF